MTKHMKIITQSVFLSLVFLFVGAKYTYAYIDPGTGSYVFQIVIAGILGGAYMFKSLLRKIMSIFIRKTKHHAKTKDTEEK